MAGLVVIQTWYPRSVFSPIFAAAASDFPFWAPLTQRPKRVMLLHLSTYGSSLGSRAAALCQPQPHPGCPLVPRTLVPLPPLLPSVHLLSASRGPAPYCALPGARRLGHEAGRRACACPCQPLRMGGPLESLALDLGEGDPTLPVVGEIITHPPPQDAFSALLSQAAGGQ